MAEILKTLKDLDIEILNTSDGCKCREIIRKEAGKWIKFIDEDLFSEKEADYLYKNKISGLIDGREWIKHFFNIKEDDLK